VVRLNRLRLRLGTLLRDLDTCNEHVRSPVLKGIVCVGEKMVRMCTGERDVALGLVRNIPEEVLF
jgi:hypothetical protein